MFVSLYCWTNFLMHQLLLARGTCSILLPWQIISIQNCKLNHVTIKKKRLKIIYQSSIMILPAVWPAPCPKIAQVKFAPRPQQTLGLWEKKIFHIKWSCLQFSDIQNLQTVSKKVMTMSSCLEKGEGSSSKLWSPLLQSKALFLKCWRLRYFLLKHSRCVNYHSIQMKFRPDVGFLLKLQHKGQLVFVYLTGVESFVNSEESVPLSFTGKTTQLLLSKKLQGGLVCQNHSFSRIITPRNPTY